MPVLVDGVDLRTLGFIESGWTGDLAPAVAAPASTPVPGVPGEVPTGAPGVIAPRTLTITGTLCALRTPWTPAQLEAAMRALTARCAGGSPSGSPGGVWLAVSGADAAPTVRWRAHLTGQTTAERQGAAGLDGVAAVSLVFTALAPWAEDVDATVRAGANGTAGDCPLGTAVSLPVVTLHGPLGSRILRVGDGAGRELGALHLATPAGVAAGASVEVDCAAHTVAHVAADGTRTPRAAWLAAGDFLALDPAAAVPGAGALTLGVEGTGGGGGWTCAYRRRWR